MIKKNKATTLLVIGMMFTTLGLTIFANTNILMYTSLFLGLSISIYSVFESDKPRKEQMKLKKENSTE